MDTPETTGRSKDNFYTVTCPFLHWTLKDPSPKPQKTNWLGH